MIRGSFFILFPYKNVILHLKILNSTYKMDYLYLKSLHIIFVITWFAGLFYMVRLFVYHTEATEKPEPEKTILTQQFKLMEHRLWYIITLPSSIITFILAGLLLYKIPSYLNEPWMHVKLLFVGFLYIYQWKSHQIFKQLQNDEVKYSSTFFRIWNEVATLILFAVVFLVVLKSAVDWMYGTFGIILLSVVLMLGIKMYKKAREKKQR